MTRLRWRLLGLLAVVLLTWARPLPAADKQKIAALPTPYQQWLAEVKVLIRDDELRTFLELEKDYQRDAFIARFWKSRDDVPETERCEFKERFYERLATARARYETEDDDRFNALLLNGEPHDVLETDCGLILWPVALWSYNYSETLKRPFELLFYQKGGGGPFRLWLPGQGFADLVALGAAEFERLYGTVFEDRLIAKFLDERCISSRTDDLIAGIRSVKAGGIAGATAALRAAPPRDAEWLATFQHFSTDLPAEASTLDARFAVSFPGTHQSRTVVQGVLAVPAEQASTVEIEGYRAYNLQLTGEVLRGEELFETFRYRFDLPAAEVTDGELPLFFERFLRPGSYRFVLKLEDLNAQRFDRHEVVVEVPSLQAEAVAAVDGAEEEGEIGPAVELVEPPDVILTGPVRFEAVVRGDSVRKVAFALDDKALLAKKRPPYSVDVSLGSVPRTHTLTAVAYDEAGREVARDDLLVNAGQHYFAVEIVEPRGTVAPGKVRVRVEVAAPEGAAVERLELYRNDVRLATLYSPPYVQPLRIGTDGEIVVLRAAAFLTDGNSTEDVVLLNAPGLTEETDVRLVELFTTVIGQDGRPRQGLARGDFTVFENGDEQQVLRFDRLDDLPIHAALLIDTSASMRGNLDEVNQAALRFLRSTITPKDRAAIITFSEHPFLAAPLTHDMQELARALAGLKAERSTALYDSIVFSLFYLKGITGQRALLVLSDGEDRLSEYGFDETLELAAREGVTIYAVGIELKKLSEGRRRLARLAEATGGRSFFIKSVTELDAIYDAIQEELRSQYLLAYQSSHGRDDDGFRVIEVKVSSGGEARTLRGYYP